MPTFKSVDEPCFAGRWAAPPSRSGCRRSRRCSTATGRPTPQGAPLPEAPGHLLLGNGVKPDRWVPDDTGRDLDAQPRAGAARRRASRTTSTVVSGMSHQAGNERATTRARSGILSGAPLVVAAGERRAVSGRRSASPASTRSPPASIGTTSQFKSLEVGISTRVNGNEGTTLQLPVAQRPRQPEPARVRRRRRSSTASSAWASRRRRAHGDAGRRRHAGASARACWTQCWRHRHACARASARADKMRLDQHVENVRSIENRLTTTRRCRSPARRASCRRKPATPSST